MRKRHLAGLQRAFSACICESLNQRIFLCSAASTPILPPELLPYVDPSDGQVAASVVLRVLPQFQGKNLWAPETFNPSNSANNADWTYDPRFIRDDLTGGLGLYPAAPTRRPEAAQTTLPDLVPLTGNGFLSPFIDTTQIPGHNLMRFSTAVGNMGTGPASLTSSNTGTPPAGSGITSWINPDGTQNVLQQLYTFDGTKYTFQGYRPAGQMIYHPTHGHFHLEGYASYRLLTKNADGSPGPVAIRTGFDGQEAVGDKIGFCLLNILSSFTLPGTSTSSSTIPGYNKPGQPSTGCGFLQGISTGKADVYDSIYDGQWIDVTGVPNGNYLLEVTLDARNVIQETNETNNTVIVPVTLNAPGSTGGTILPDRFEPNNTPATASDLGVLGVQTQPGLTMHITNEDDYFKFVAASTGPGSVQLSISNADVNLFLYDSNLTLLGSSTSPDIGTATAPASENVNANFVAGQTYYVRAEGFGTAQGTGGISSGYALKVLLNPTVNATAPTAIASEVGLSPGTINVARNGPTSSPLIVNFTTGGTATRGVDYALYQDGLLITGNQLTIGNEALSVDLQVVPLADNLIEANETVLLSLGTGAYFLGATTLATVVLRDTPPAAIGSNFEFEARQAVSFDFSLNVGASLAASDLILTNTTTGQIIAASGASYDSANNRATFTFGNSLPDGRYTARIPASSLTHSQGVQLASDATLSFYVLAGDLNRDSSVTFDDVLLLVQSYGQTGRTFSQGNINYDPAGTVDFNDLLLLVQRYGVSLATAAQAGVAATDRISTKRRNEDLLN